MVKSFFSFLFRTSRWFSILWKVFLQCYKYNQRFYLFLERGKERERRNINIWLPLTCPLLGTWPTTQACALMGNCTRDPLVHRPVLDPLSHTSQGQYYIFLNPHVSSDSKFFFLLLILERGEGREGKRERSIDPLPYCMHHNRGMGPDQNRTVTFGFAGWRPTNWATLARALMALLYLLLNT